jgi:hypothetical protein
MATQITAGQIRDIVAGEWESSTPDEVLEVFRQNEGKPFSKRILAKLPGGEERWIIRHIASMTNLEEKSYSRTGGNSGISLLVSYDAGRNMIDAADLEKRNPAYFSARKARNAKRLEASNDATLCQAMADAVNAVRAAREALAKAEEAMINLTAYDDGAFYPDRGTFEALAKGESK